MVHGVVVMGECTQGTHCPNPRAGEQNCDGYMRQKHRPSGTIDVNPDPVGQGPFWRTLQTCGGRGLGSLPGSHGPRPPTGEQKFSGHMLQLHEAPGVNCENPIPSAQGLN